MTLDKIFRERVDLRTGRLERRDLRNNRVRRAERRNLRDPNRENRKQRAFREPDFLRQNDFYFYRVLAIQPTSAAQSNFTREIKVSSLSEIAEPVSLDAVVPNVVLDPLLVKLNWALFEDKLRPDFWVIERREDKPGAKFKFVGKSYLETSFVDRSAKRNKNYIYRVRSVDVVGRKSKFLEVRVSTNG